MCVCVCARARVRLPVSPVVSGLWLLNDRRQLSTDTIPDALPIYRTVRVVPEQVVPLRALCFRASLLVVGRPCGSGNAMGYLHPSPLPHGLTMARKPLASSATDRQNTAKAPLLGSAMLQGNPQPFGADSEHTMSTAATRENGRPVASYSPVSSPSHLIPISCAQARETSGHREHVLLRPARRRSPQIVYPRPIAVGNPVSPLWGVPRKPERLAHQASPPAGVSGGTLQPLPGP